MAAIPNPLFVSSLQLNDALGVHVSVVFPTVCDLIVVVVPMSQSRPPPTNSLRPADAVCAMSGVAAKVKQVTSIAALRMKPPEGGTERKLGGERKNSGGGTLNCAEVMLYNPCPRKRL